MHHAQNIYQLLLEINKLKLVFRNTRTQINRQESSAEHSWSASMIVMILLEELKKEFNTVDEMKAIKLSLIHDIVEIYAGDVTAFDAEARKDKEKLEIAALDELKKIYPVFGQQLHELWYEFEKRLSLEAQIAKAADAICPMFQRLQANQSYIPFNITLAKLEKAKYPHFKFSQSFTTLYQQLITDLLAKGLL
jgi:putative hydrolases of HD superfamily